MRILFKCLPYSHLKLLLNDMIYEFNFYKCNHCGGYN